MEKGTADNESLSAWEEWAEQTSREQVAVLRENNRKKTQRASRRRVFVRLCQITIPVITAGLIVFLFAAPAGRAMANAAIQGISGLIDQIFYLAPVDEGEKPTDIETTAIPTANSNGIDKIIAASRRVHEPLLYLKREGLMITRVTVDINDAATTIITDYRTSQNDTIMTIHSLYKPQTGWGGAMDTNGATPQTHKLFNGETLYYSYTREGYAYGMAHWGDTSFSISSTTLKWEKLLEFVDALVYAEDQ